MFKLIKILNSGVNVPEPIRLPKAQDLKIKIGSALLFSGGTITACPSDTTPTHISMEDAGTDKNTVLCHDVTPNMLFETYIYTYLQGTAVGDKVELIRDEDGMAVCVDTYATDTGVATVVDLMGSRVEGDHIIVKF